MRNTHPAKPVIKHSSAPMPTAPTQTLVHILMVAFSIELYAWKAAVWQPSANAAAPKAANTPADASLTTLLNTYHERKN